MDKNRYSFLLIVGALVLSLPAFAQEAVVKGVMPGLTLTDQNDKQWADKDLGGKYTLVHLGFSHCESDCPLTLPLMGDVLKKLGKDAEQLQAIFISIDARDNPKALKEYMSHFDSRILALSGTQAQTDSIINAYELYTATTINQQTGIVTIGEHAPNLFLIGKDGTPVGNFEPTQSAQEISDIIKQVIHEKDKSV